MKYENYIFSGHGFAHGNYPLQNEDISYAIERGFLQGFSHQRVENGESYSAYRKNGGKQTAFGFMAEEKMGFKTRYHVVPFPPLKPAYDEAENALDLCVRASREAIEDSGIHPDAIDAWIVGTATAHEMAPGLASSLKAYFVPYENQSSTMSLTSACVGFNINLERAILMLKHHPEYQHILIAHTEVMSELLVNCKDFVPFTTFGDAAAAVVLSRVQSDTPEGVTEIINHEDLKMIDFLGADAGGNLYMEPRVVKSRAVPDMTVAVNTLLKRSKWTLDDISVFVPHQTGNAIVHEVGMNCNIPQDKVYQEIQLEFGNLSGASVPAAMHQLSRKGALHSGDKLLTAVAGLGGEYGGFTYIVPKNKPAPITKKEMAGKTALISGATGDLGAAIAEIIADKAGDLILLYRNEDKRRQLESKLNKYPVKKHWVQVNLAEKESVESCIHTISNKFDAIDYVIHTAAATGNLARASEVSHEELERISRINHLSLAEISMALMDKLKSSILFTGSVAEEAQFSGSSSYVASKKGLHGFASDFAQKIYPHNLRCIYYLPGIIDAGMMAKLNDAQKTASMMAIGQKALIKLDDIANRMVQALYLPKVSGVRNTYEGVLRVIRDAYPDPRDMNY